VIIDTSVLLAIVFRETGFDTLIARIDGAAAVAAGTPTLVETGIVLTARLQDRADGLLERLLDEFAVQEIAFTEIHWREAVDAFRRYGKGRHAAQLNFGDCMTYATAKLAGDSLLYVGDDFARTDIPPASY
jgi:ribonuclease VapC